MDLRELFEPRAGLDKRRELGEVVAKCRRDVGGYFMNQSAEWLSGMGKEVSKFGERAAELVWELYGGIYHVQQPALKADWSHDHVISITVRSDNFGTYDSDLLTRLVILSHKHNVKTGLEARANGYIRINLINVDRWGYMRGEHPTLGELQKRIQMHMPLEVIE